MYNRISGIIWDWNGTLLDDTHLCLSIINDMLEKRSLPILSFDQYREVFSFPVKDYYEQIGFNFEEEPFEVPAKEFIDEYNLKIIHCALHSGAKEILQYFKNKGFRQFVLSAMMQDALKESLQASHILDCFEIISGLDNHYAASKIETGKHFIEEHALDPNELCLVGDTIHDHEVAAELGCSCILVADGHQSKERLLSTGRKVISNLSELQTII